MNFHVLSVVSLIVGSLSSPAQQRDVQIAAVTLEAQHDYITPVAVLRDGKLLNPVLYRGPGDERIVSRFIRLHYPNRSEFQIWQAGVHSGEARIVGWEPGCYSEFDFHVTLRTEIEFDKSKGSLALSSAVGATHPSYQRNPTPEERQLFSKLSQSKLSESYPAISSAKRSEIHDLVVTKASRGGNALLAGSISFRTRAREYWLFAIFEKTGQDWLPAVFEIHPIADLEDRKDAQEEGFLDQLDVDGDGVDEFFTRSYYYEASSFAAYGLRDGKWKQVYKSGVGGC